MDSATSPAAVQRNISTSPRPVSAPERRLGPERLAAVLKCAAQLGASDAEVEAYLADAGSQPVLGQPGTWREQWASVDDELQRQEQGRPEPYPAHVVARLVESVTAHTDQLIPLALCALARHRVLIRPILVDLLRSDDHAT